ncbi:hypothetical protein C7271_25750 [filamentous cyanobacterium CCP5]|nr:hypothetical protein C7271_25750 [filamentous cyanobacterium CCP5]
MAVHPIQYDTVLSRCTQHDGALELLRRHRPYLETVPSMRRPGDSIVTLPLPNVRVRENSLVGSKDTFVDAGSAVTLPCDVALLMCDPEWQVKTGVEIFVFIHRPQEDFYQLLMRWRRTERLLAQGYEWLLPKRLEHLLSDGADDSFPLFVAFPQTPHRIIQGLQGAALPVVVYPFDAPVPQEESAQVEARLGLDNLTELDDIDPSQLDIPESSAD